MDQTSLVRQSLFDLGLVPGVGTFSGYYVLFVPVGAGERAWGQFLGSVHRLAHSGILETGVRWQHLRS